WLRHDRASTEPQDWAEITDTGDRPSLNVNANQAELLARISSQISCGPRARVRDYSPRRVELELPKPATDGDYLLARDTWEPHWTATVDGVPTPVLRADFVFRAVKLPAGAKRVVFEYDATSARIAFALQSLAW